MNFQHFMQRFKQTIGRYGLLLLSMFFMIAVRPFLDGLIGAMLLTDIFAAGVSISGVYALSKNQSAWRVSFLLVILVLSLKVLHYFNNQIAYLFTLEVVFGLLLFILILGVILRHIFTTEEVTSDVVTGGACVFVLLGFIWSYMYSLLELAHPDSFKAPDYTNHNLLLDFNYYSFVTLTTVGYGDIVAITSQARGLSILEAIVGQLYLAIILGRLIGLHAQHSADKKSL
jgi:hypothetical protein